MMNIGLQMVEKRKVGLQIEGRRKFGLQIEEGIDFGPRIEEAWAKRKGRSPPRWIFGTLIYSHTPKCNMEV